MPDLITQQNVGTVANLLEISDFELFRLAWQNWHGELPSPEIIEADFGRYLDYGEIPYYVAHYTRSIMNDKDLMERERRAFIRSRFIYYTPLLIFFILFMYFLLR